MLDKKVCLIIPDSVFMLDSRVFPFLGILSVAAVLEKKGYHVDVLDLSSISNWEVVLTEYLQNNKNVQVGLGATSPQMPMAYKIARFIKSNFGNKIILGGTHPSLSSAGRKMEIKRGIFDGRAAKDIEDMKKDFDVLVYGEGEIAIFPALSMEKGEVDADDKYSDLFLTKDRLDKLPMIARHLIDLPSYKYKIDGRLATSFISELGCYFKCSFCAGRSTSFLRYVRQKSSENIKDELRFLYKEYGFTAFQDYSDEINVPKNFLEYTRALIELQDELGVDFKFRAFIKAELFDEIQAKSLYDAGFRTLLCGFESADERILSNIRKIATKDDNTKVVEICHKYNLNIKALCSCGHSGESHESIEETKKWLLEVHPTDFDMTVIVPFCGSPYFDEAVRHETKKDIWVYTDSKNGDKLYQKSVNYESDTYAYKGIPGEYVASCYTDFLTSEELVKARDDLENEVRTKLNIPFNQSAAARQFDHSMGQGNLPDWILRSTETHPSPATNSPLSEAVVQPIKSKHSLTVVK